MCTIACYAMFIYEQRKNANNTGRMPILTRKPGESLLLGLTAYSMANTVLHAFFEYGPIRVRVMDVRGRQVKLGSEAAPAVKILRAELVE
jgi:sRNA-binding carbon storage regulator CsrA